MARTFSYQKQHRNRQALPLRASWRVPPPERSARGPFVDLADKVRQYRERITQAKEQTTNATDHHPEHPAD